MIDAPQSLTGWLNLAAHVWALLAYLAAAVAGVRALSGTYDHAPAWPSCLVADATRWLFGLPRSPRAWRPRDFISLGVFGAVLACGFGVANQIDFLNGFDWRKLGGWQSLLMAVAHIITGSVLIILHCGVGLLFSADRKKERART